MRDDFLKRTITEIAKGAGYRCSNPDCRRPTDGSNAAQDGTMTIGVAAHICAASAGGPRYNAVQTGQERRSKENGIWLCQTCGRLVDADPTMFTVELLLTWKYDAQSRAFRALVAPSAVSGGEQARVEAAVTADDAQAGDAAFDALLQRIRSAAATDLAAHRRGPRWPAGNVELTLRIEGDRETPSFSISKLPLAIEAAPEVTIVALPGTGKTTTLLQLAGHAVDGGLVVPLYFRLGDWSAGSTGLLASLSQRAAFDSISAGEFAELAARGRLLLLLDGWNELETGSRNRLRIEVAQIRRDWPNVRIIVTTRQQMLDVPIAGPRVEIEPLSEDQQMAIADAGFGAAGTKIVDTAWRTSGIRELVTTPLYLSALLSGGAKGASPATKEGVLSLFVAQHEQAGDHAEVLQSTLLGCHTEILTELAIHLNAAGTTTVAEADARRIVTASAARLRETGQIAGALEPLAALEVLISRHSLMRSGGGIAFQHQQFQEWYASNEVAALMRTSAEGDTAARVQLRAAILDQPAWEESVLFAVERLSGEAGGPDIIAAAIRLALPIDPMLAAEMIYRAPPAVWELVKAEIVAFVARWHKPGTVDRAVRFMIMTGRPEFAAQVWPLASSVDTQTQIPTLRIAPRFRPQVLGAELRAKVATLPEETREHLLALIASESGADGMDLAVELARADPSPKVQAEVVQYLQFRRADRHVAALLSAAHEETWALIASRGYAEEISDPAVSARLQASRQAALDQASDPSERLGLLLGQPAEFPARDEAIAAAIADPRFPINDRRRGSLRFAHQQAPDAVLQGLRHRLETGLELPFHAFELLRDLPVTDEGSIARAILDTSRENRDINAAAVMAGPQTISALVDKYLACARNLKTARNDRALADEYHRVKDRIHGTRPAIFAAAVMSRADTDEPETIASLASLVSQHGSRDEDRKQPIAIDPATKEAWIGILRRWVETVIAAPNGKRNQLNQVSNAIGRFGFRELVPELKRLLDEELARLKKAIEGSADARRRGDIEATSDASMRYDNQYQASFTRIGGEEVAAIAAQYLEERAFGLRAALILKSISDKRLQVSEPDFHRRWPWFDEVAAARATRAASPRPAPLNTVADPIFAAIDRLATPEADNEDQQLAIGLARVALSMPHGDQDALITRVINLPQPLASKQTLLAAMVLDGQIIDSNLVMQAIDEWLADANDPKHAWHKRQNTWEIEPWLELLPFTTRPEAVLEGLTKVKAFYGTGWTKQWERVLDAVAAVPAEEGLSLLTALVRAHKDIAHEYTWMRAIIGRGTSGAALLCADLFIEGVLGVERDGADAWHVGREIAECVQRFPELKPELRKRYEMAGPGPGRAMLEQIFGEAGGEDDLIAMIAKYAADGRAVDGSMASAVRAIALDEVPVSEGSSTYNIYPAPVGRLRKTLFDLLSGSPPAAALAKKCLIAIDHFRDEHGIAGGDTRHPDVMSERPWPPEALPRARS